MGVLQDLLKKAAGAADAAGAAPSPPPASGAPLKFVTLATDDGARINYPPPVVRLEMMGRGVDPENAPDGTEIARLSYAGLADPWYPKGFAAELERSRARHQELAARADEEMRRMSHSGGIDDERIADFWRNAAYVTPSMSPLAAYAPMPIRIKDYDGLLTGAIGDFDPKSPGAGVNVSRNMLLEDYTGLGADQTAAHELNHAASIWDQSDYGGVLSHSLRGAKRAFGHGLLEFLMGQTKGRARYLADMVEVDPRLAAIRRSYTFNTGRSVNNVDDAEAAWRWWSRNGQPLAFGYESPIDAEDFRFYDSLDPDVRKYLMHRMTVTPALLAPLMSQPDEETLAR